MAVIKIINKSKIKEVKMSFKINLYEKNNIINLNLYG